MSLFGSSTIGADNRRLLLTLRAGRMFKSTQDNLIHPDVRSGILSFTMEASGVIEMKWEALAGDQKSSSSSSSSSTTAPGNNNPPSESTVIMPGGAKFDRVTKCTTGRVFVIDFGSRQLFYWLQEQPDNERDQNYFRAIKNAVEGKTRQGASLSANSTTNAASSPSSATGNAAANANSQAGIQLAALQNILTNLGGPSASSTSTTTATTGGNNASPSPANNAQALSNLMSQMQRTAAVPRVSLQDVIRSQPAQDALRADPAFYMSRLFEALPPGTDPSSDVVENVMNPQFASSAASLSSALSDPDGYREIMHAFGLTPPAGVPPSPWGLIQAVLNEKPQEKNKTGEDAAPASKEGNNKDSKGGNGGGDNTDAASA
jgi:26S proteasome regulatory subunit N13